MKAIILNLVIAYAALALGCMLASQTINEDFTKRTGTTLAEVLSKAERCESENGEGNCVLGSIFLSKYWEPRLPVSNLNADEQRSL